MSAALYELCAEACRLNWANDWPTILILPDPGLVRVIEENIASDWITVEYDNGIPRATELIVNTPYGADEWDVRTEWLEPANFMTPSWLYALLFDYGDIREPVIIQPQVTQVDECDECEDGEMSPFCDHISGWALLYARRDYHYPAAASALSFGPRYADYIEESTAEHVAKGHYSEEHAMSQSLGDMLVGNDGD